MRRWLAGWIAILLLGVSASAADERNPLAGSAKAAKAGEYEFRINCASVSRIGGARRRARAGFDAGREETYPQ